MASLNIDNSTIDDGNTSIIDGTHITHRYSLVIFPSVQYWKLSFQCWAGVKNCLTNIWAEKTNKLPFSILILVLELNKMQSWQKSHFWCHSNFQMWLHDTFQLWTPIFALYWKLSINSVFDKSWCPKLEDLEIRVETMEQITLQILIFGVKIKIFLLLNIELL